MKFNKWCNGSNGADVGWRSQRWEWLNRQETRSGSTVEKQGKRNENITHYVPLMSVDCFYTSKVTQITVFHAFTTSEVSSLQKYRMGKQSYKDLPDSSKDGINLDLRIIPRSLLIIIWIKHIK